MGACTHRSADFRPGSLERCTVVHMEWSYSEICRSEHRLAQSDRVVVSASPLERCTYTACKEPYAVMRRKRQSLCAASVHNF